MFYEPKNGHGLPRNPFISCVIPRPIGWISTLDRNGLVNLAPYSLFNIIRYDPPAVMFCATGPHKDGGIKDSAVNARETGEFVYNMATWELREEVNLTSAFVDRGVDEMALAGLKTSPSILVKPPRVARSPIHFECRTLLCIELPREPGGPSTTIVFGDVIGIHIADEVLSEGLIDVARIRPLARLGYKDFSSVQESFAMPSPNAMLVQTPKSGPD
jgi:flavin reductase (DIM6/NTAB) family NADH-FMN oxidoreductase RutF